MVIYYQYVILAVYFRKQFNYFFPNRVTKKIINAITAITKNIPTPIPVLKIPPITEQPEMVMRSDINIALIPIFFILQWFLNY